MHTKIAKVNPTKLECERCSVRESDGNASYVEHVHGTKRHSCRKDDDKEKRKYWIPNCLQMKKKNENDKNDIMQIREC